jgi:hypothetical protein
MMFLHGKDYYLAPIYPMLFAAGSVFWESLIASYTPLRFLRRAIPATVIAAGMIAGPLAMPILPPDRIPAYMAALGIEMTRTENGMVSPLPQHFADQFGWPEMVARSRKSIAPLLLISAQKPLSSQVTMEAPAQSISSARNTACPNPSALTKIIIIGDPATTREKASFYWNGV